MKVYYDALAAIQQYIATGDKQCLETAKGLIDAEIADPSLSSTILTLRRMSLKDADSSINEHGFLRLPAMDYTTEGAIHMDKFLRVKDAKDGEDGAMLILKVAHIDPNLVVLVPYGPGNAEGGPQ